MRRSIDKRPSLLDFTTVVGKIGNQVKHTPSVDFQHEVNRRLLIL